MRIVAVTGADLPAVEIGVHLARGAGRPRGVVAVVVEPVTDLRRPRVDDRVDVIAVAGTLGERIPIVVDFVGSRQ